MSTVRKIARTREELEADFRARYQEGPGCWEWTAGRTAKGYGVMSHNHRQVVASRLAWEVAHGPIPDGMSVLHHCDNPPCVRPDHLFLGTTADNMRDKATKGRAARGERNGSAKLTARDVLAIRAERRARLSPAVLAERFNITRQMVRLIETRKKWAHLDDAAPPDEPR